MNRILCFKNTVTLYYIHPHSILEVHSQRLSAHQNHFLSFCKFIDQFFHNFINYRNNNQVRNKNLIKPPMITHANPFFHSAPAPAAKAIGNIQIPLQLSKWAQTGVIGLD
jgi:hypothetical protein